jgi:hypothetical protein
MDANLHDYVKRILQSDHVQSVLLLDKDKKCGLFLDGADLLYMVIVNRPQPQWEIKHVVYRGRQIVEYRISQWQVEYWSIHGGDERIVSWFHQAEVVYDQHDYVTRIRERFTRLSDHSHKLQVCKEYSRFLRHYVEAKELLQQQMALDAYQSVLHALHGWARLVTCEAGEQPQVSIWNQVKNIDSTVYKLYEELIASQEPLEKRIELLLLPIEFSVMSKMKSCTQFLIDILQTKSRPWSITELYQHPELIKGQIDLHILLDKMVKRSLVQEVVLQQEGDHLYEKGYILVG